MAKTKLDAASIRAVAPIYVAAMLEELQFFSVMDRLVERFRSGRLPIGRNASGEKLYRYWKQQPQRLSQSERRSLYGQVVGLGGGDEEGPPNREFGELWLRFVSVVSSVAEQGADAAAAERRIRQQAVRTAGRDLATNLSLHGHGLAYFAAAELQAQIKMITSVLSDPEVQSAYGARSMWEVIDKVASVDLGGAPNVVRHRTMAEGGSTIISWLARRAGELAKASSRPILGNTPEARRLIAACEQWILARAQPQGEPSPP